MRLAELVGGLSLATDLGAGLPLQSAISAAVMASRMARRLDLSEAEIGNTYYAAVLRFIGCTAVATEEASLGAGDDLGINYAFGICDPADPEQVRSSLSKYMAKDANESARRNAINVIVDTLVEFGQTLGMHCAQAVILSRRIPVDPSVPGLLGHMYDRFDGQGSLLSGQAIPLPARICAVAAGTMLGLRSLGKDLTLPMVFSRKGTQFCPDCVDLLQKDTDEILKGLTAPSVWEVYLDAEPGDQAKVENTMVAEICTAYADYADQKSGYLLGHSRKVAQLSFLAGEAAGLNQAENERLRRAALLHDVGRAGVTSGLWNKPGALSPHERRVVQSHANHTETVLSTGTCFENEVKLAASAHERADGKGYPRQSNHMSKAAGILSAADIYESLTHDRPWRKAFSPKKAAETLLSQAKDGALSAAGVSAVLEAAGHAKKTRDHAFPAGLSRREAEVLGLLAQGLSTRGIAERLNMAPNTAENHIGHIYEKTGARGRAAAALFAVEHGITAESPAPEG